MLKISAGLVSAIAALCLPAFPQTRYLSGGTALLNNGITVFFSTVAEPPFQSARKAQDGMRTSGNLLQRFEYDAATNSFFGYDLSVDRADAGQFRVVIGPLTMKPEDNHFSKAKILSLPKYPDPQVIHDGDTIALDLLVSEDGKQKVVDYIRVVSDARAAFSGSGKPNDPQALFRKFSDVPKDFTVDDLRLDLKMPCVWLVNGKELQRKYVIRKGDGATMWFYYPGRGRFFLSLSPQPASGFQRIGVLRGSVISFRWGADEYEIRSARPILDTAGAWNLYGLNDPAFRPVDSDPELLVAGAGRLNALLHR